MHKNCIKVSEKIELLIILKGFICIIYLIAFYTGYIGGIGYISDYPHFVSKDKTD